MWGLLKEAAHREQYLLGSFRSTSVLVDDVDTAGSGSTAPPSWADLLSVSSAGKVSERLSRNVMRHSSVEKCGFYTPWTFSSHKHIPEVSRPCLRMFFAWTLPS